MPSPRKFRFSVQSFSAGSAKEWTDRAGAPKREPVLDAQGLPYI